MKKLTNKVIIFVLLLSILFSVSIVVFAEGFELGQTEDMLSAKIEEVELLVSNEDIDIQRTGESKYLTVEVLYSDGTIKNISDIVDYKVEKPEIVTFINYSDEVRLLGDNKGMTKITLFYNDLSKTITVNVLEEFDIKEEIQRLNILELEENQNDLMKYGDTFRDWAVEKAMDMVDVSWTPTKNLTGFNNKKTFYANTTYYGIPYSQTEFQRDDVGFIDALNNKSDFYNSYTRNNLPMPKYGNDCSGFVSFAWDLKRHTTYDFVQGIRSGKFKKIGNYDASNPSKNDLLNSYIGLKEGDAVVYGRSTSDGWEGHTFIVARNDARNGIIYAYEQTPTYARYSTHYYDDLARIIYMPFTTDYMDIVINRIEEDLK